MTREQPKTPAKPNATAPTRARSNATATARNKPGPKPRPKRPATEFLAAVQHRLRQDVARHVAAVGALPVGFEVEDFAQEGARVILERYDERDSEEKAYNYGLIAAKHHLHDELRKVIRRESQEWRAQALSLAPPATPEEGALVAFRQESVQAALQRLPPTQRQAAVLLYCEGRSRREVAEIMHLSVPAVKSLAQRATASLRRSLRNVPGIAAWRRLKPSWVTATVAPRLCLGVLCLAVVDQPQFVRLPHAADAVLPVSERRLTGGAGSAPRSLDPHGTGAPPSGAARGRAAPPLSSDDSGRRSKQMPSVGGRVGPAEAGVLYAGDELCLEAGQEDVVPLCANQDVISVCPTADRLALPGVRCTQHGEPTHDP